MKFLISKTSDENMEDMEEAKQEEYIQEVIKGEPEVVKGWFIEINTLQELLNLQTRFKHELIITTGFGTDMPEIEIYDTWRE